MRERPDAREVVARWAAEAAGLCWFVPLEEAVIRFTEDTLEVRIRLSRYGYSGTSVTVDGLERHDGGIPLVDDQQEHAVEVR